MYNDNFMNGAGCGGENAMLRALLENSRMEEGNGGCCEGNGGCGSSRGCGDEAMDMRVRNSRRQEMNDGCSQDGCGSSCGSTWGLSGYPLASVYSPLQEFCDIYDIDAALSHGTVFKELDLPFLAGRSGSGCGCAGLGGTRNG